MTETNDVRARIVELAQRLTVRWTDEQAKQFPKLAAPTVEVQYGQRYARIIRRDGSSGSAAGFVDMTSGAIYYPKGWKGPVTKQVRGSVLADDYGMSAFGRYGVNTLR